MNIGIINVGDELVNGMVLNSNAQFLCQSLTSLGYKIKFVKMVGDNETDLKNEFLHTLDNCDILIITGGLGPTMDDITREVISSALDKELFFDENIMNDIEEIFKARSYILTDNNRQQAYKIKGSKVIDNSIGTAPGLELEYNNKLILILPGPPIELKTMFEEYVQTRLSKINNNIIISKMFRCVGIGESRLETLLKDELDNRVEYGIYANNSLVDVKITVSMDSRNMAQEILNEVSKKIENKISDYVYSNNESLEEIITSMLLKKGLTISIAESCTGGLVSSRLINTPRISKVFKESITAYSNDSKSSRLEVSSDTINTFGAVSIESAREMAFGVTKNLDANIGVSVTGIAGPDGGTDEKPIGLVYICVYHNGEYYCNKFHFHGNRNMIRARASTASLMMLYNTIKSL